MCLEVSRQWADRSQSWHISKKSIIQVKDTENCLAHALIIAIARIDNDSIYESYRKCWKIRPVVLDLIEKTVIDLCGGAGIPELERFQEHFREYKMVVYLGLSCDNIEFEGRIESAKRLNLFYDDVERKFHVITILTGAMAKRCVTKGGKDT